MYNKNHLKLNIYSVASTSSQDGVTGTRFTLPQNSQKKLMTYTHTKFQGHKTHHINLNPSTALLQLPDKS